MGLRTDSWGTLLVIVRRSDFPDRSVQLLSQLFSIHIKYSGSSFVTIDSSFVTDEAELKVFATSKDIIAHSSLLRRGPDPTLFTISMPN